MKRVFRLPWTRRRIDTELGAEFQFHLRERVEQFVAAGMTRAEAEAEASRRFGDFDTYHSMAKRIDEETMRRKTFFETAESIRREIGLAARVLRRSPSFSLIAVVTLSLGIGAATAIFTVLDAVILRPLPYPQPDRLVTVLHPATVPGTGERKWGMSAGGYFSLREQQRSFTEVGVYMTSSLTALTGTDAEVISTALVTASIFPLLGARPHIGRLIDVMDDQPDSLQRVVISHEYWQRRFGSDPRIVGAPLRTSSGVYEIIGVTQPGFSLPIPVSIDAWLPSKQNPRGPFFNSHPYAGIARLKPGVTVEEAQREMTAFVRRLPELVPDAYRGDFIRNYNFRGEILPLKESTLGPTVPRTIWAVFGAVILVMVIAVANVANLFIVRIDTRRRESTLRTALGADRSQMAMHYLAESLMLCAVAGAAGVLISAVGLRGLLTIAPTNIPRLAEVSIGWQSASFAAGLSLLIGIVFGLMPLTRRTVDLSILREGGRGLSPSRRQRAFRAGLVVSQMAFALILLSAAGLMIRSFIHLRDVEPGFDYRNVAVFSISLPFSEYDTREKSGAFHREMQRRIGSLPGVTSVGSMAMLPLEGYGRTCSVVWREGRPYPPGGDPPCVAVPVTAPGTFETLRINVRGRTPTWTDFDQRTHAVVITQALADRLWPGEDPIGKGIGSNGPNSTKWFRVVGVIPEIRAEAFDRPFTEAVFYAGSNLQEPNRVSGGFNSQTYVVRTTVPPSTLLPSLQKVLSGMNPRVPFRDGRSMEQVVERSMTRTSFLMILLGISAAVALLLSAVGLYGVISYVVTQRRFEIGVRIALGARISEVARLIITQSLTLAAIGVGFGLVGAFAVTRLIQSMLFNVSPADPVVLVAVVVTLIGIATVASLGPARRAARIDPIEALRAD